MNIKIKYCFLIFILIQPLKIFSQEFIHSYKELIENYNPPKYYSEIYQSDIYKYRLQFQSADAKLKSPFDVIHYTIVLDWTPVFIHKSERIKGVVNLLIRIDTTSINRISLDAVRLQIDTVFVNNSKVIFEQDETTLDINLGTSFYYNDTVDIKILYQRTERSPKNIGFYYYSKSVYSREDIAYTLSAPSDARYWFPCKDQLGDKATIDMIVTVPKGYSVISNGILISKKDSLNTTTYYWHDKYPLKTYVISATASKYISFSKYYRRQRTPNDSVEIKHFIWQQDSSWIISNTFDAANVVSFFSEKFGEYPFDIYKLVSVYPFPFAAMSNQTVTQLVPSMLINNPDGRNLLSHEIAHQWFGSYVNAATWADVWLNEGFATYADILYMGHIKGWNVFRQEMNFHGNSVVNWDGIIYNPPYPYFRGTVYTKGACVLDLLHYTIGDSLFWRTIQNYLNRYAYGSATTDSLLFIVNQTTLEDYSWFFDQWVYKAGYPIYSITWNAFKAPDNNYYCKVLVRQTQTTQPVIKMPIEILIKTSMGDTTFRVFNSQREQEFEFKISHQPIALIFDPNQRIIIKKVDSITKTYDLTTNNLKGFQLYQNFPNPFNPNTIIKFSIPNFAFCTLKVYDLLGREIVTLIKEPKQAGEYEIEFDANKYNLFSGVYFYQLRSGNLVSTKKFILAK
jgi:aminopeptidase N